MLKRLIALAACAAIVGCAHDAQRASQPAAAPYAARVAATTRAVVLGPRTFRRPIADYKRHVVRQLALMLGDLERLDAAVGAGRLAAARRAWLRADARYESIGAAYGAFGELDRRINGLPGGLVGGARSRSFTGLHRIELALWKRRSVEDAAPFVRRLARDVGRLRTRVPRLEIPRLDFGLRAHEVLEDALHLQLAGRASPWASNALGALEANIHGTYVVLNGLGPIARPSNAYVVRIARRRLTTLERALAALRRGRSFPRWDTLPQLQRERIAALTAGAAEQLAYVPGLVDPRPPQRVKNPVAVR